MGNQEELSNLQKQAEELVKGLEELHKQVGSYKSASGELAKVTEGLTTLVEKTKDMTSESHKVIQKLNEINTISILEKLDDLNKGNKTRLIIIIGGFILIMIMQVVFFLLSR